jgi:uncharacterized protein
MKQEVLTPNGRGQLHWFKADNQRAVVLLSHGAGTGIGTLDLQVLATRLPKSGWSVALFEQAWLVSGRKVATPPGTLDAGLSAAASQVRTLAPGLPLVLGGRSAGARSAARCSRPLEAAGTLLLAFPLHPPGKPEKSRVTELLAARDPLLIQGANDAFGRPEEFPAYGKLAVVPHADHSFKVAKRFGVSPQEVAQQISGTALNWLSEIVGNQGPT